MNGKFFHKEIPSLIGRFNLIQVFKELASQYT